MLLTEFFENDLQSHCAINENSELSDIISARELIGRAISDPQNYKHKYFEFLKHLRTLHGSDYSTKIHQKAAKLAQAQG